MTDTGQLKIRTLQTAEEWRQYYHCRWVTLRQPWGEPEGSEKDTLEDSSCHRAVFVEDQIVGVGRLQFNSPQEAQIRYMAVAAAWRGKGVGKSLVSALEALAMEQGTAHIKLDARENAVAFYESLGYKVMGDSYLLFGKIQHYLMHKNISGEKK